MSIKKTYMIRGGRGQVRFSSDEIQAVEHGFDPQGHFTIVHLTNGKVFSVAGQVGFNGC